MALQNEFAKYSFELGSSLNDGYGAMTPYDTTKPNNGALNPPGAVAWIPAPAQGSSVLASAAGYGSGLYIKYVRYLSTTNPAVKTGPAPVYWADETFTKVTGTYTEGVVASNSNSAAGWLLPNSGVIAGIGAGTTLFTATLLNNGGNGSWVWIGLQGFIPSASLAAGAAGSVVYGSGDFAVSAFTDGSTINRNVIARIVGTVTSNIGDIIATCPVF